MLNPRDAAAKALLSVEKGERSNEIINRVLKAEAGADIRDRSLFTRLFLGTLSNALYLDYLISVYSSVPLKKIKPLIRSILQVGFYQLYFLDNVPAPAIVNEAVKSVKKGGLSQLSGFVNAILRKASADEKITDVPQKIRLSIPDYLHDEIVESFGADRVEPIMTALYEKEAPLTARFNLSRAGRDEIIASLESQGIEVKAAPVSKNAYFLYAHPSPDKIKAFQDGLIQFMDLSSILAVEAAGIRSGERVLDLCAAPGGKSMAACDNAGINGSVTACDVNPRRLRLVEENAARCGFKNIITLQNDGTKYNREFEAAFDTVIADLPCSGLGTIGHKPEIKYRASSESIDSLARLQGEILDNAVRYIKPGGKLVFSTCTFTSRENDCNAERLLNMHGLEPLRPDIDLPGSELGYLKLMPDIYEVYDGFYISCFRRK